MLVGRRLAIGALRSAVDAAVGGAGGVVLLAGEVGMGFLSDGRVSPMGATRSGSCRGGDASRRGLSADALRRAEQAPEDLPRLTNTITLVCPW